MPETLHILLLEDEQRAGEKLIDLINATEASVDIVWKRSVVEGIDYLRNHKNLDLIFSDIELLDGKAFEIYAKVKPTCPIIFCTAYDKFYVDAFQTNGIAYLLKPYSKEQFEEAWEKYNLLFSAKQTKDSNFLENLKNLIENKSSNYKKSFPVKKRDGVFLLQVEAISYFQANGDFVLAYDTSNKKHALNYTLSQIEEALDPKLFFRINRSEIVKLDAIEKYASYTKNRLAIHLTTGESVLFTSNSRSPGFRNWFEG